MIDSRSRPGGTTWGPRLVVVVVVLFCAPMFIHPLGIGSGDAYRDNDWFADQFFPMLARKAIFEFGEFPLRSHLVGGGFPTIAHPFSAVTSPTFLITLIFGPVLGPKFVLVLLLAVGALSMRALLLGPLGLSDRAATFGAAAFAMSGWLPSMMLVGFYPQAFYLLTPLFVLMLLDPRRRRSTALVAAVLLALILQRAGNATVAIGYVIAVLAALSAAAAVGVRSMLAAAGAFLAISAALALREPYGFAVCGAGIVLGLGLLGTPPGRAVWRPVAMAVGRLASIGVLAGVFGAGRLAGLGLLVTHGDYAHDSIESPTLWPGRSDEARARNWRAWQRRDEGSWDDAGAMLRGLLYRAPDIGRYAPVRHPIPPGYIPPEGPARVFAVAEYDHVGLTPPLLLLALLGAGIAARAHPAWLLTAASTYGICWGAHLPPDLRFLLLGGIPPLDGLAFPIKYFSFFLTFFGAVFAALAFERIARGRSARFAALLGIAVLLWPLLHNASAWPVRFRTAGPPGFDPDLRPPVGPGVREEGGVTQVSPLGSLRWLDVDAATRHEWSEHFAITELERPSAAREYDNALRNTGTIDWYGTLVIPSPVEPDAFVLLDGTYVPNPAFRGVAWVEGAGTVAGVRFTPNTTTFTADLPAPARVVVNQTFLPGFRTDAGMVVDAGGRLAVDLPAGRHTVRLRYRPMSILLGLCVSAGSLASAPFVWFVLRRRESQAEARAAAPAESRVEG